MWWSRPSLGFSFSQAEQKSPSMTNAGKCTIPACETWIRLVEDKLSCYVCPMLASHGEAVEAVTWERVQQATLVDPSMFFKGSYCTRTGWCTKLRREIFEGLPTGHQGVVYMWAKASNCVFWVWMDQTIPYVRIRCMTCDFIASSQADEPSITAKPPVYQFQTVCTDYCELGRATYLVVVDRYSG